MAEERGLAVALMEQIRADSAETRLSPATGLASLCPGGGDPGAILDEAAEDDIKLMRGSRDRYYFSDRSMTERYARHLYRLAERDPVRLVADTTRDESSTYPRPTPVATFLDEPFYMSQADVDAAIASMATEPEYADIRTTAASNGDRYLFSTRFLGEAHAAGLAEWASVGEKENP
jgi:hypothetical protein